MVIATLFIWDSSITPHGIPKRFYSYLISVSRNQVIGAGDKIIQVLPMTEDTPKPKKEGPIIIRNDEKNDALDSVFKYIEDMECFQGLNKHRCIVENDLFSSAPAQKISFKEN